MNRSVLALLIVCWTGSFLLAETPSTSPATKPAKEKETVAVKRGSIDASIDADGYFDAIDPLEVRVRPKQYQGELVILSAAANGAHVQSGETILQIDPKELNRQLAAAENELLGAQASAEKAQADLTLGEQADALAMKIQQNELDHAEAAVKWFDDVDGKQMLTQAQLGVTQTKANVDDQQDELDQLKKMYKSEELTNATADIVVKRALRNLEIAKVYKGMSQDRQGKVKDFDFTSARQKLMFGVDQEKQQMAQLQVNQAQSKVLRQTALASARAAAEKAQQKMNELKEDQAALTVKAPSDGAVVYGQMVQGIWQNSNSRALRAGEKVQPGQVLMTFFVPGKLRFVIDVPEAKVGMLGPDMTARVVPTALPAAASSGKCGTSAPAGFPKEGGQVFPTPVEMSNVDARLLPGEKGSAHIDAGSVKDALVVPSGAVKHGRVRIPGQEDGVDAWKEVVVGMSDGESVEIKSGLNEGDEIYPKAAK